MSKIVDVKSPLFKDFQKKFADLKQASEGVVVKKPKAAKTPGSAVSVYLLGWRTIEKNGTQYCYTVGVPPGFRPEDVNIMSGQFINPNEFKSFVFEQHKMTADEMTEYKKTHEKVGNRTNSELVKVAEISLHAKKIEEIWSWTPWTVNNHPVQPGMFLKLDNLRREDRLSADNRRFNTWKCENVKLVEMMPHQLHDNYGRVQSVFIDYVSMKHTETTPKMYFPDELAFDLMGLGPSGNKYKVDDLKRDILRYQTTPQQKEFMKTLIVVPIQGSQEELASYGATMYTPVNFKTDRVETTKDKEKVVYAIVAATAFVWQLRDEKMQQVQLCFTFSREVTSQLGIQNGSNLAEFADRLLKGAHGTLWGDVDILASREDDAAIPLNQTTGEPLADYSLWVNVKLMAIDLPGIVFQHGLEINEELARFIVMQADQSIMSGKCAPTNPLKINGPIYNATESPAGIDHTRYRYFLFHSDYDETRPERMSEIKKEKNWSDIAAVTNFSNYLMNKAAPNLFKPTDFKKLELNASKLATVFGISITECERITKGSRVYSDKELIELHEEAEAENASVMKEFLNKPVDPNAVPAIAAAPTPITPAVVVEGEKKERDSSPVRASKPKAAKKPKSAGPILDD